MAYLSTDRSAQKQLLQSIAEQVGFQDVGISHINLEQAGENLENWLEQDFHGEMHYMKKHGAKRYRPAELVPGTISVIAVRLDYLPEPITSIWQALKNPLRAVISRYALGRDYHKVMRQKLKIFVKALQDHFGSFQYRLFTDSAPVMEKPLAEKAGLGWIGKNTNLINRRAGSFFFLGMIYTDLALIEDAPVKNHCGSCQKCLTVCPTQAIVAPYLLDARKCISYLTIEHPGSIPVELRPLIGNRIYGCDDCQAVCPWNRYAKQSTEADFQARHGLEILSLIAAMNWSEKDFLHFTEGSAIRRIGYARWQRNVAIALGNAPPHPEIQTCLQAALQRTDDAMVREHIQWALSK